MAEFKDRLRELRVEKDMSQTVLALYVGSSRGAISYYESGEREPSAGFLLRAKKFFDCSVDYLLGVSEVRNPYEGDKNLRIQELEEKYSLALASLRIVRRRFEWGLDTANKQLSKLEGDVE